MAAHKGPASLRPRCTRSGSSIAAIPVYIPTGIPATDRCMVVQNSLDARRYMLIELADKILSITYNLKCPNFLPSALTHRLSFI
jgi:hypothetical protein